MLCVSALQTFTAWGKVQDAFARPEGRAKQNGYRQMCGVGDAVRYSLYVTGNTLLNEARFDGTGVRIDGHRFAATSPGGLSKSSEGGAVWSVFDVSASPDRHPVKVLGSLLQKIKKNSLLCPLRSTECGHGACRYRNFGVGLHIRFNPKSDPGNRLAQPVAENSLRSSVSMVCAARKNLKKTVIAFLTNWRELRGIAVCN